MDCLESQEILTKVSDMRAASGEIEAVRAHVAGCPVCRAFEAELRDYKELMRSHVIEQPVPGLSDDFDSRFYARLDRLQGKRASAGWAGSIRKYLQPKPAFALGLAAAALMMAIFVGRPSRETSRISNASAWTGKAVSQAQEAELSLSARAQAEAILGQFM